MFLSHLAESLGDGCPQFLHFTRRFILDDQ
jgi:hypothetical protein